MVLTTPIPPDDLIFLVSGHRDREAFEVSREVAIRDVLLPRLAECGVAPNFETVLDFGCGCGRLLAGWEHQRVNGMRLIGVDINPKLVAFCQQNIPFAETRKIDFLPPLPYDDASIDLIYAASVFTHLELDAARQWADELTRIARPNGTLVVTFHGDKYVTEYRSQFPKLVEAVASNGHATFNAPGSRETFKGSNDYASFHTIDFIAALFKDCKLLKHFDGNTTGPTHFTAWQDMAIFQKGHSTAYCPAANDMA